MTVPSEAPVSEKIATLRAEIARHDERYYRAAQPEISDADYDALKRELADLERQFPLFAVADSPTQQVGDDRTSGFATYRHRQPMQSLDNTYSPDELREFDARLARLFGREMGTDTDAQDEPTGEAEHKQRAASALLDYVVEPKIDGIAVSLTYERGRLVRGDAPARVGGESGVGGGR